jgi:hypothetical protein
MHNSVRLTINLTTTNSNKQVVKGKKVFANHLDSAQFSNSADTCRDRCGDVSDGRPFQARRFHDVTCARNSECRLSDNLAKLVMTVMHFELTS